MFESLKYKCLFSIDNWEFAEDNEKNYISSKQKKIIWLL